METIKAWLIFAEHLAERHPWLLLLAVGMVNEFISRHPKIKSMTVAQIIPNILAAAVTKKAPTIGAAIGKAGTPEYQLNGEIQ